MRPNQKMPKTFILLASLMIFTKASQVNDLSNEIKKIIDQDARYKEFTQKELLIGDFGSSTKLSPSFSTDSNNKLTLDGLLNKLTLRFESIRRIQKRVANKISARSLINSKESEETVDNLVHCNRNLPGLQYDQEMRTEVARNTACTIPRGPGHVLSEKDKNLLSNVSTVFQDEENQNRWPRRIHAFTSLEGDTIIYPALNTTALEMSTPQRQWLKGTLHPKPKDIVIIYDASPAMTANVRGTSESAPKALKHTVMSLMATLSTKDRVAIILTDRVATTPSGRQADPCFSSELAFVTTDLKHYLQTDFLENINHDTPNMSLVFQKAFSYFKNDKWLSNVGRERIMLMFLAPRDLQTIEYNDAIKVLNEGYRALNYSIKLFHVNINVHNTPKGNHTTNKLLSAVSQAAYNLSAKNGGSSVDTEGPIRWFHNEVYSQKETIFVASTFPKLGATIHCCSQVKFQDEFVGLLCTITPTLDAESEMGIPEYFSSYGFVLDNYGELLMYPTLSPTQNLNYPVRIQSLERSAKIHQLLPKIVRGERVQVHKYKEDTDLYCGRIGNTSLSLCLVYVHGDDMIRIRQGTVPVQFWYHRLEYTVFQEQPCMYYCAKVHPEAVTYMLTEKAFWSPALYPGEHQTRKFAKHLALYMQNEDAIGDLGIKDGVRAMYSVAVELATAWLERYDSATYNFQGKWLYAGFINGIFVCYPGVESHDSYDHTTRPWYMLAMSNPKKVTFTRPYIDYATDLEKKEYVISMCKAILVYLGLVVDRDLAIGVLCIDYSISHFQSLVSATLTEYCPGNTTCFFIDHLGYIIAHKSFLNFHGEKPLKNHITEKEPSIARVLLAANVLRRKYCVDISAREEEPIWEVNLNGTSEREVRFNSTVVIYELQDTNIFLIVVKVPIYNRPHGGKCSRYDRFCQPDCGYNCTRPAPIDECSFIYNESKESGVLPFCPSPMYGRDQDIDIVCSVGGNKSLRKCDLVGSCNELKREFCEDSGCMLCERSTIVNGRRVHNWWCQQEAVCEIKSSTVQPSTYPTNIDIQIDNAESPTGDQMSVLIVCISIVICLIFIVIIIGICTRYPSNNSTNTSERVSAPSSPSSGEQNSIIGMMVGPGSEPSSAPTEEIYRYSPTSSLCSEFVGHGPAPLNINPKQGVSNPCNDSTQVKIISNDSSAQPSSSSSSNNANQTNIIRL